ncbi:MAG: type IV pilus biogenesis/stability protein PilW [Pseudomonadota bacterium]
MTSTEVKASCLGGRILLAALALLLAGCVTQTESVFTSEASMQDAMEQRVALARQYIGQGNWEDAKRNLKAAVEISDRNPEIYEAYALVYQSTGEVELAEDSFKRAISLDKKFSRARNNYAAFLFSQERYEEAEAQLNEVVKDTLYNARPTAFANLGLARLQLNDRAGAEEAFSRSLSMQPESILALLELAILRLDAGDAVSAQGYYRDYRKLLRVQSPRGLWFGIRLARATGNQDAESSYALALRNLYPNSPEYAEYQRSVGARPRSGG